MSSLRDSIVSHFHPGLPPWAVTFRSCGADFVEQHSTCSLETEFSRTHLSAAIPEKRFAQLENLLSLHHRAASTVSFNPTALVTATRVESRGLPRGDKAR